MAEKFENIVVGAGFAGLTCAGYLAKSGQKTLLLEKGSVIGGRAAAHPANGYNVVMHLPLIMTSLHGGGGYGWANAAKDFGADIKLHFSREVIFFLFGSIASTVMNFFFGSPMHSTALRFTQDSAKR